VKGVELSEDEIELPDEPVTTPQQLTVYVTVCNQTWTSLVDECQMTVN